MKETWYYFSTKFPQHGIDSFVVTDKIYYTSNKNKYLHALVSSFNVSGYVDSDYDCWNVVSAHGREDDDIYVIYGNNNNVFLVSQNIKLLTKEWEEEARHKIKDCEKIIKTLEGLINGQE